MRNSAVLLLAFCVSIAAAQEAPKPQFTARELFYSASSEPAQPAKPAPKTAAPAPAPKPTVAVKRTPVQPKPTESAAVTTPTQPEPSAPVARPAASESVMRPDGNMVVKTALVTAPAPESGTPLGIRYTVLMKSGDDMVPVPPGTVFHSGDRIQLSVQTNGPGYLYIIHKGTSGTWSPMFPSPEVADGDNHVTGWNANVLPPGSRMMFTGDVGIEHLFIVFSRTPEDSLEKMIYSLQDRAKAHPAADKSTEQPKAKKYVMSAAVEIPDSLVGHLSQTYTRDLIIEKVDDKTPADKSAGAQKPEDAVYVVNPSGNPDSRVVADVQLEHQ
jgi:hypothetical protein